MKHITHYSGLCDECNAQVARIASMIDEFPDDIASDPEGPLNVVYDRGLFCGGYECTYGEQPEPEDPPESLMRLTLVVQEWGGQHHNGIGGEAGLVPICIDFYANSFDAYRLLWEILRSTPYWSGGSWAGTEYEYRLVTEPDDKPWIVEYDFRLTEVNEYE